MSGGIKVVDPSAPVPPGKYAAIEALYSGNPAEGEKAVTGTPREAGKPLADTMAPKPYVLAQLGRDRCCTAGTAAGAGHLREIGLPCTRGTRDSW